MKWITILASVSLISPFANAKLKMDGKCAKAAAHAAMEAYNDLPEGDYFQVVSSTESRNPAVYKVVAVGMDGTSEPFTIALDVTLDPKTCQNPSLRYSK
ncbi:MAG: hypothetical protein A4S09_05810 [Proteobacteria bacterium SG_bin7]|nr:MAG: hypothetical protein A4S09_05810 [Proteobacteria bacterium SG_bin7]